jgi:hypothetical protein
MPADLPLDQSRDLAHLMLRLHAEFRARHGLPRLPTVWTLPRDLEQLRPRSSVVDEALLASPKPLVGRLVGSLRRAVWGVLRPVFYRQSEVNRDLILALEALAREREQARHSHYWLSQRVHELELDVARLTRPE